MESSLPYQAENESIVKEVALELVAKNPGLLASFYVRVFEANFVTLKSSSGPIWHHGELGSLELVIRCDEVRESNHHRVGVHLKFTVEDIEKVYKKALAHGAAPVTEPNEFLLAQFCDPDGNLVSITEELPF